MREVVQGVIALVGGEVAGVEPRVELEGSVQVSPEPGPFVLIGRADVDVQGESVIGVNDADGIVEKNLSSPPFPVRRLLLLGVRYPQAASASDSWLRLVHSPGTGMLQ